jgi:para-nitrobenzyl esterase
MTLAHTPFGTARGLDRGGTTVFKGIRYATSERFEQPRVVTEWQGETDASTYQAQCFQTPGVMERTLGASSLPMSEDCLFLNVYTPRCDDARRPVLVWIHGGAFVNGSGATPWYDGSALATRADVVVVTINYRLGAFGYLGDLNLGTYDQIAALRWVHETIASFGGDPENVTIVGESAGGSAVVALLATPSATGLFHRAWAMSPSIGQLRNAERGAQTEAQFLDAAGVATREQAATLSAQAVLDAQQVLLLDVGAGFSGFSPTSGTELIPQAIRVAAAANTTPVVIGTTRDEMQLFSTFNPANASLDDDGLKHHFERRFGDRATDAIARYRRHRPGVTNGALASAMQTDETFRVPARQLAQLRSELGSTTWMYWFTWASTAFGGALGSCHALDIPFAFHNLHRKGVDAFTGIGADRANVADAFSDALTSFARCGKATWPEYNAVDRSTLRIDATTDVVDDPEHSLRELWEAN